ncbi:hypothetical protein WA026_021540 [Henosepilachna vigintioctopunctata]|uniref:Succinate dehydrogenase [ubiquinone] cytochrome b small subunit n=1 Tax=Henosepilachna vigintioctopunctata TaxID=420089 RepID=A0AAW1VHN6_9CUCU
MALSLLSRQSAKLQALTKISQGVGYSFSRDMTKGFVTNERLLGPRLVLIPQMVAKRMMSSNHAHKWKLEKLLTIIMLPVIPATFGNPGTEMLDNLFAILVTTHAHFGLEAIAKDYVRPIIFGPVVPKIAIGFVYALTATTLGSLLYFNHHNIGIGAAGKLIWSIGKEKKQSA